MDGHFLPQEDVMFRFLLKLLASRSGPTAIEYGLVAALVAVATIGGLTSIGTNLNTVFNTVSTNVGS